MTERRRDDLRKGGTQGAGGIFQGTRDRRQLMPPHMGDMTQFVNDGALLCHHQQQQKAQGFEQRSHRIEDRGRRKLSKANRMLDDLLHPWHEGNSCGTVPRAVLGM